MGEKEMGFLYVNYNLLYIWDFYGILYYGQPVYINLQIYFMGFLWDLTINLRWVTNPNLIFWILLSMGLVWDYRQSVSTNSPAENLSFFCI